MSRIYVVGLGPGDEIFRTKEADAALKAADIICGYTLYADLIREQFPEKEFFTTGMRGEEKRCAWAVETAKTGKDVAVICSGDSGIYGMACLIWEMAEKAEDVEIIVVPGVTAAVSAAARLGAPLGHDFCVISLSDLLTPWEVIEKRLFAAGLGDFVIAIYNPSSKTRADYLRRACEILLKEKSEDTPCGYVRNIGREGEEMKILSLRELMDAEVDMFTTVIVGSSSTKVIRDHLVTPRGYHRWK
ncbi:MAG: precorrin-3B C(17)-methyltransferase [Clostridiales bacterium]|nr:precorrin-3B C(17)-methyltransferase [Clostridiales bacterium]